MSPKRKPALVAVVADLHCGSTLAVCPPKVRLHDGGFYESSDVQTWLWQRYLEFWQAVDATKREARADLYTIVAGDAMEGHHHGSPQTVAPEGDDEAELYIATTVFDEIRKRKPKATFVVRGTEVHVGQREEWLGRYLHAERDAESGNWSRWHLRLELNGCLIDCQHHGGRVGTRPWTRRNTTLGAAGEIWMEHAMRGLRAPDLAIRAHRHIASDSGDAFPTRLIVTPAWQCKTSYAHKVAANSIADIGGVLVLVEPDGRYTVRMVLSTPALPQAYVA